MFNLVNNFPLYKELEQKTYKISGFLLSLLFSESKHLEKGGMGATRSFCHAVTASFIPLHKDNLNR